MSERRNNSSFLFSDGLGEKGDPKHLQSLEVVWALDSESRTSREFPPFGSPLPPLRALVRMIPTRRQERHAWTPGIRQGCQALAAGRLLFCAEEPNYGAEKEGEYQVKGASAVRAREEPTKDTVWLSLWTSHNLERFDRTKNPW